MMIAKERPAPSEDRPFQSTATSKKNKDASLQLEKAVLMLKYSNFIRKVPPPLPPCSPTLAALPPSLAALSRPPHLRQVFDDQPIMADGTVNGPKFLLDLYQTLESERLHLSSEEDRTNLEPLRQVSRSDHSCAPITHSPRLCVG
jgi:hypothetical protein